MSTSNQINLTGRVIGLKIGQGDEKSVPVSFGIAVRRSFKNKEGKYDDDVINCVMFGKGRYDYLTKYLAKNGRVQLVGELRQNSYEKDGVKHNSYSVVVSDLQVLDYVPKDGGETTTAQPAQAAATKEAQPEIDFGQLELQGDSLPF